MRKGLGYIPDPDLAAIQMAELVHALNPTRIVTRGSRLSQPDIKRLDPSPMQGKLRELVGSWIESGPDLLVMFRKHPSLEGQLQGGSTLLLPMRGGKAYLEGQPFPATLSDLPPEEQALRYFALLITNPLWHRLGGPCARCGDYYLKNTVRQKTYCSRRCGSIRSAAEAVERRRENEYQQKIQRAQAAIEEWRERKRREEWDSWVARHAKLTRHWITRAANERQITPPSADPRSRIASAQRKRWAKHKKEAATKDK